MMALMSRQFLIPAVSPAGVRVKARMARHELESGVGISRDQGAGVLLSSLFADLGEPLAPALPGSANPR
jgi:hypothetical protein